MRPLAPSILIALSLAACNAALPAPTVAPSPSTAGDVCRLVADGTQVAGDIAGVRLKSPSAAAELSSIAAQIGSQCVNPPATLSAAGRALLTLGARYLAEKLLADL